MADNPITVSLPADLPVDWAKNQVVAPEGADVGLSEQHGYNYLMQQVNATQQAASQIGQAFSGLATLGPDGKVPKEQLPEMAGKPKRSRITLSAAGWKREPTAFGICHQSVAVAGILADETRQLIIPMPAIASQAAYAEAGIVCTNQTANSLTFSAKTVPSGSITVYVAVQEVTA